MFLKAYFIQLVKGILIRCPKRVLRWVEIIQERRQFIHNGDKRFSVKWKDLYPCLSDKLSTTPFDQHYILHPAWAARVLQKTNPTEHYDFSSILSFSTIVSAFIPTKFYDYRPVSINLSNWQSNFADLMHLPFEDQSLHSISCMHTIEHIGLGRYGDKIDAFGDIKAANELKRVLAPNGNFLVVTPVGKSRIEFNAHRIYSYQQVLDLFEGLTLQEFSLIPDEGGLIENADPSMVANQSYACGCFWFKKQ